ncbi:MAG: arabinofuranosidase catalytic domain-containing protein [Pseudomonadota bacterium]
MKSQYLFASIATAFAVVGVACSNGNPSPAGGGGAGAGAQTGAGGQAGASNTGGSSGAQGGSASCGANVVPCGGVAVGSWTVTPSCLSVSGERSLEAVGLGCVSAPVTGALQVSGSWSANADGTFTDQTTTTGTETLTLAPKCLEVSGTTTDCARVSGFIQALGYESAACTPAAAGGCSCVGTVNHKGGVGLLSADSVTTGNYTVANNVIKTGQDALSHQDLQFAYCVANGKMSWSPQVAKPTYTGSIAFQSGGLGGSGGSGGTGGTTSSGGSSGSSGSAGTSGSGGSAGGTSMAGTAPCDIYEGAKTPCVGAFSTVRALYNAYSGPLYQVRSKADKTSVKDIPLLEAGGYANSKVQDDFCTGGCTISKLYDQSAKKNDLVLTYAVHWLVVTPPAGPSQAVATESNATDSKITVGGHTVYGVKSSNGVGAYRVNAKGVAVGDAAEAMYEVVDSNVTGPACCDDFGNVSTTGLADGEGTMETIFYSKFTGFGHGAGSGPWLMADLEFGVYPSDMANDSSIPSLSIPKFATLLLNGFSGNRYALKAGDAQTGALKTTWDGKRPNKYSPMKKGGAIVLGTGGDGSFLGAGVFFEGAITMGCPDDKAVDDAIQASVVAAGYGK